jgi:hypothetical protein
MAVGPEVLYEFVRLGAYVKVTAIDPQTGIEASVVGPPSAGESGLKALALRKLQMQLSKRAKR